MQVRVSLIIGTMMQIVPLIGMIWGFILLNREPKLSLIYWIEYPKNEHVRSFFVTFYGMFNTLGFIKLYLLFITSFINNP